MANTKITTNVIADNAVGITQLNVSDGSNGQVLTTNGSGTLSFTTISAGVAGISTSADATAITIDSSERVGIGTTSPTKGVLVVSGAAYDSQLLIERTDTSSRWGLGGTDSGAFQIWDDNQGDATRLVIDSAGEVGIGTASPANNLHIHTDAGDEGLTIKSTGNTSNAIIFDANRSGSGNSIGEIQSKWNGTTVAMIASVTGDDTTNKDDGYISFYASAANDLAERMRVTRNNGVYFGDIPSFANNTYAHAAVFSKNSTPNGTVVIEDSDVSSGIGNTVLFLYLRDSDPANFANYIIFRDGDAQVGAITHNDDGGGVTYGSSSDYRLKENVNYTWEAIPLLKQLKPAKFNFKRNPSKTIQGLLAHEVADIVPSSVRGNKDHMEPIGTIKDSKGNVVSEKVYEHFCKTDEGQTWTKTGTEPVYQQLDYSRLVPLLTKALQEQQTIIEDLKTRIEALEK